MFYVPGSDHQRPTHSRLHLRDARDAQVVLEAVRLGILQIVSRRLNDAERSAYIRSGSVFVWEESDDELGLKRWTDGRFWSQSRMREPFLFYEERVNDRVPNEPRTRAGSNAETFRFVDSQASIPTAGGRASTTPGLIKQTYSAFVHNTGPGAKPRKWHLTAYLTYADVSTLPTIDLDPTLRAIIIPPSMYRSAKARSRQVDLENTYAADSSRAGMAASPVRLASPYPQVPSGYPTSPATPAPHAFGLDYQAHMQAQQSPQVVARYPYAQVPMQSPMPQHQHVQAQAQYPVGQYAAQQYPASMSAAERAAQDRLAEDQRVISMLNSRTHM
ncbi:hypothetical protein EXIGLDRAFT_675436 [Exidia glandulosa HHB12029]|uniref:Gti1/Pac2 family-domain-containing protein n=1 Tax=Exidia glandulosa HHB12029 TaxID=1314781 RepID=A0A165HM89_EXIGL|nr:hypothetical protein EXIGLDRAFT_675436 [Exidia glandulosa HHB12029]